MLPASPQKKIHAGGVHVSGSLYEIRASYDASSIVIYQAYNDAIADAALKAQRFVSPFSMRRMTWIKPSFLWLMHRSSWAKKAGQTRVLGVRIARGAWDEALSRGVLTHPEPSIHGSREAWRAQFEGALVHVQWDTERGLRGQALDHYSIQVGLTRHLIEAFATEWIVSITDETPRVHKIAQLMKGKDKRHVARHLPQERAYPVAPEVARRLLMT